MPSFRHCVLPLFLALAVKSPAQVAPASPVGATASRQIEVFMRSHFALPPEDEMLFGPQTASAVPGYNNLPVTLLDKGKANTFGFLISNNGKTLARLETFDIATNPALSIDVKNRPVRGDPTAKVEIINFDDLECPFCAELHRELSQETLARYKDLVKIVYKDYPLEEIHPWAMHAAVDANCLASLKDTAYWAYVDYVHSHAQEITGVKLDTPKSVATLDGAASTIGKREKVDGPKLEACVRNQD